MVLFIGGLLGSLLLGGKKRRAERAARRLERAEAAANVRRAEIAAAKLERDIPIQRGEVAAAASAKTGFTGSSSGPGDLMKENFELSAAEARELARLGVDVSLLSQRAVRAQQSYQKLYGRYEPWLASANEFWGVARENWI